ncbi:MAG: hypothetical protein HY552_01520 [Elusimicrobia bacterium]|nr:hypothetical protein [Elusimicrobiota bacterium]
MKRKQSKAGLLACLCLAAAPAPRAAEIPRVEFQPGLFERSFNGAFLLVPGEWWEPVSDFLTTAEASPRRLRATLLATPARTLEAAPAAWARPASYEALSRLPPALVSTKLRELRYALKPAAGLHLPSAQSAGMDWALGTAHRALAPARRRRTRNIAGFLTDAPARPEPASSAEQIEAARGDAEMEIDALDQQIDRTLHAAERYAPDAQDAPETKVLWVLGKKSRDERRVFDWAADGSKESLINALTKLEKDAARTAEFRRQYAPLLQDGELQRWFERSLARAAAVEALLRGALKSGLLP